MPVFIVRFLVHMVVFTNTKEPLNTSLTLLEQGGTHDPGVLGVNKPVM